MRLKPGHSARTGPTRRRGGPRSRVLVGAVAVLLAAVGAIGFAGAKPDEPAAHPAPVQDRPRGAPTITRRAVPLGKAELERYRPIELKVKAVSKGALVSWRLPPDAHRDGAGIIIRRHPADDDPGMAALSADGGRLAESYVAAPLHSGRRYCFLVGVLLWQAAVGTALAQSGPVCAQAG